MRRWQQRKVGKKTAHLCLRQLLLQLPHDRLRSRGRRLVSLQLFRGGLQALVHRFDSLSALSLERRVRLPHTVGRLILTQLTSSSSPRSSHPRNHPDLLARSPCSLPPTMSASHFPSLRPPILKPSPLSIPHPLQLPPHPRHLPHTLHPSTPAWPPPALSQASRSVTALAPPAARVVPPLAPPLHGAPCAPRQPAKPSGRRGGTRRRVALKSEKWSARELNLASCHTKRW